MAKYDLNNTKTEQDRKSLTDTLQDKNFSLTVKFIHKDGYAFLTHPDFSQDIFLRKNKCKGYDHIAINGQVTAQVHLNPNKDKWGFAAINASIATPANCSATNKPRQEKQPPAAASQNRFYNPYTFVPSPPRDEIDSFAGDQNPLQQGLSHERLVPELWSGTLTITASLTTPLVLPAPDPEKCAGNEEHLCYQCKKLPDASEIRGMLRSAYETITNSRYHGFTTSSHTTRLGLRSDTQEAIKLVPARVITQKSGQLELELLPGISGIDPERGPQKPANNQKPVMYAAWLQRYQQYKNSTPKHKTAKDKHEDSEALRYSTTGDLPQHQDKVYFTGSLRLHQKSKKFQYFCVTDVIKADPAIPKPTNYHEGHTCITGRNMTNKHYERIFFNAGSPKSASLDKETITDYELLVKDYQQLHEGERNKNEMNDYLGHEPGKTGFSRHVWADNEEKLKEGDLVFARVRSQDKAYKTIALYPVMMSRQLYPEAPADFLPESLKHANEISSLSPADRLFGWVSPSKQQERAQQQAYKGRIRMEVPLQTPLKPFNFRNNLVLPILGEPRLNNGRFYVAQDKKGTKQPDKGSKLAKGYNKSANKGLRGRKHYWHPQGKEYKANGKYWQPDEKDKTPREYRGNEQGKQNRSLKQWLSPGQEFTFNLHLDNVTAEEAGGILWLLQLDKKHHFKLGYGKPLGFGSVQLSVTATNLAQGNDWLPYYQDLFSAIPQGADKNSRQLLIHSFMEAMVNGYPKHLARSGSQDSQTTLTSNQFAKALANCKGREDNAGAKNKKETVDNFLNLPFVAGFLKVAAGPGTTDPIHYPRTNKEGSKVFEWFGVNEKGRKEGFGRDALKYPAQKLSLPHIIDDKVNSLPYDPVKHKN